MNTTATGDLAWTEASGKLPGLFSVAGGTLIRFSRGNLVATINESGAPTAWKFATNQYDCLRASGANVTIGSAAGDVDLFGWSTNATNNNWGIHTKTSATEGWTDGTFKDWGENAIDGAPANTWRTPTHEEWKYLFETRSKAWSLHKTGVTVCGKTYCVIIAPDNWDTSTNPLQEEYSATSTPMTWEQAQSAGLVCLAHTHRRSGSDASSGELPRHHSYWSSNACGDEQAYYVDYTPPSGSYVWVNQTEQRYYGQGVRLISDAN